jgi:16S rRNA (cytosine967-C5)-methyltransferase
MSRFHSYINSAETVIKSYKAGAPLTHHLKLFFQMDKKFGSRDRRIIAALCYHYYRCARLFNAEESFEQNVIKSSFLCETSDNEFLKNIAPELNELVDFSISDKLEYLKLDSSHLFEFEAEVSEMIDKESYFLSYFIQPSLFVRIRPGRITSVIDSLKQSNILYSEIEENTLEFSNGTSLENCLKINKDVVIQDLNSQRVFDFFKKERDVNKAEVLWDCCAASGGKSILLFDICRSNIKITVSDIRENILTNLQLRFKEAGINIQKKFVQDLSTKSGLLIDEKFSIVLCDVPCTGSGTWSRTPEQYYSFDESQIQEFASKQKAIVVNALRHLAKDGWFIYITCSVFKKENEDIVEFIQENYACQLLEMKYLKGYNQKADTLFVAYFKG